MKFVVPFGLSDFESKGDFDQKFLLGGKGAGLCGMAKLGLPVPPGLVVTTEAFKAYRKDPKQTLTDIMAEVLPLLPSLAKQAGIECSPIVSVRSGAPVSMPGMMDTILNVGLCNATFKYWADSLGRRTALDSTRRLVQMIGSTVYGVDADRFEECLTNIRAAYTAATDADLPEPALRVVLNEFVGIFEATAKCKFPSTMEAQLEASIQAVFESWGNERAIDYRRMQGIDESMGTAVVIQTMVFGNAAGLSGSGVLFTRNPSNGDNVVFGEFLPNAQGEDVVAGVRTPLNLNEMHKQGGEWGQMEDLIVKTAKEIETTLNDVQDIEFTIQSGKLFVLQTRNAKRTASAAVKIATDLYKEGKLTRTQYVKKISSSDFAGAQVPAVSPSFKTKPATVGLPASSGVVTGKAVLTSDEAVKQAKKGPVVLVRGMTDPDDLAGMAAAVAIVTDTGGATCHAAVVARAIGTACVVGCGDASKKIKEGDMVTVDGATGRVWVGVDVPVSHGNLDDCMFFLREMKKELNIELLGSDSRMSDLILMNEWADVPSLLDERLAELSTRRDAGDHIVFVREMTLSESPAGLTFLNSSVTKNVVKLADTANKLGIKVVNVQTRTDMTTQWGKNEAEPTVVTLSEAFKLKEELSC